MRYKIVPMKKGVVFTVDYARKIDKAREAAASAFTRHGGFAPLTPDGVEIWQTDSQPGRGRRAIWSLSETVKLAAQTIL